MGAMATGRIKLTRLQEGRVMAMQASVMARNFLNQSTKMNHILFRLGICNRTLWPAFHLRKLVLISRLLFMTRIQMHSDSELIPETTLSYIENNTVDANTVPRTWTFDSAAEHALRVHSIGNVDLLIQFLASYQFFMKPEDLLHPHILQTAQGIIDIDFSSA